MDHAEERLARLRAMEARLRAAEAAGAALEDALDRYEETREALRALDEYYGGPDWYADRAADEEGLLPPDLPRGVLSEDGIWNVLETRRELRRRMAALAGEPGREA